MFMRVAKVVKAVMIPMIIRITMIIVVMSVASFVMPKVSFIEFKCKMLFYL